MKILTIDTSTNCIHIILQEGKEPIYDISIDTENKHAELLLIVIENVLRRNALTYSSIDCFSIINGPGSFIGLKVSIAFIKALKCAMGKTRIILNDLFQVLSFQQEYDFILLETNNGSLYLRNKEQYNCYLQKDECYNLLDRDSRIITNYRGNVDFLKSSNIVSRQVDSAVIVALNHFKYINGQFNEGDIRPVYLRDPQVNTRNEQKLHNK
ncbi:MAG: tRNA (adenosine(37)-N6)-threonylcarbamoyltransferase complex dimerization subunit type 1 TsaB [Rickettsiales bacterium]|jgi:tRNA A37 threonylcarbamoyladenosine modification protein TsaB|nr:tRNA (adenosine(37)-N6)-threonylcarbamoyltransferase complex dimerization subunit type 1 TsaB [Rickettsiales bacterium]